MKKKTTVKKTKTKKTITKKKTLKKKETVSKKKVLKIVDSKKPMVEKVTIEFEKKDIKLLAKIFQIAVESKKLTPSNVDEMKKIISLFYKWC